MGTRDIRNDRAEGCPPKACTCKRGGAKRTALQGGALLEPSCFIWGTGTAGCLSEVPVDLRVLVGLRSPGGDGGVVG